MKIEDLFSKPCILGVIADVNSGKSNLLYHIIKTLQSKFKFSLYIYGLRKSVEGAITLNSLGELEVIKNSVIILDEFATLFDLDDRAKRRQIENTLRLIHHNNNILLLCGLPENFKKFISAKLNVVIYKKVTYDDLINGSRAKKIIKNYSGNECGSFILNIEKGEALVYTTKYDKINVPYLEEFDTKKGNVEICRENVEENCDENVEVNIPENVEEIEGIFEQ